VRHGVAPDRRINRIADKGIITVRPFSTSITQCPLVGSISQRCVQTLENASVSIRRTLTRTDNGKRLALGEPKTKKSRRTVRLTPRAVEALRRHLTRQMEDMERLGDLYEDQGLVFTTGTGGPINPSNLRQRSLAPLLKKAGLPHIRFHDLRHTCATLLLSKNTHPKFVQELLGHATRAITLDTYSHVLPGMGDQTARAMEDALS
jgi:integrase